MKGIRVVAPFRPFPPEAKFHQDLSDFDWMAAINMLAHSVHLACRCPFHVITDVAAEMPGLTAPTLRYVTTHRRLMLWYLEAAIVYLDSSDFDRDTVMLDSDQLVYRDLAPFFESAFDLGVLIRTHGNRGGALRGQPLLNGVQFWKHAAKKKLVAFFTDALELAANLPEDVIRWGADTEAVRMLLEPLQGGRLRRRGLSVQFFDYQTVLESLTAQQIGWLEAKKRPFPWPTRAVVDFRYMRKRCMRAFYESTILDGAVA